MPPHQDRTRSNRDEVEKVSVISKLNSLADEDWSFSPDESEIDPDELPDPIVPVKFIDQPVPVQCNIEIAAPQPLRLQRREHMRVSRNNENLEIRHWNSQENTTVPLISTTGTNLGTKVKLVSKTDQVCHKVPSSTETGDELEHQNDNTERLQEGAIQHSPSHPLRPKFENARRSLAFNLATPKGDNYKLLAQQSTNESNTDKSVPKLSLPNTQSSGDVPIKKSKLSSHLEKLHELASPKSLSFKWPVPDADTIEKNQKLGDKIDSLTSPVTPEPSCEQPQHYPFSLRRQVDDHGVPKTRFEQVQKSVSVSSSDTSVSSASESDRVGKFNPLRKLADRRKNRLLLLDVDEICDVEGNETKGDDGEILDSYIRKSTSSFGMSGESVDLELGRTAQSPRNFGLAAVFRKISTGTSADFHSMSMSEDRQYGPEAAGIAKFLRINGNGDGQLINVLEAMYSLSTRLSDDIIDSLYRHLASPTNIQACIRILVSDTMPSASSVAARISPCESDKRTRNPYVYVIVNAIASGHSVLRRSLLNNARARGELLQFFEDDSHTPRAYEEVFHARLHGMVRILSSLLHESPIELAEHLSGRKGFLHALVRKYIFVPGVADFVVELCAANPMAATDAIEEKRYGAPNASGIVLLVKEQIIELLVDMYEKCTVNIVIGQLTLAERRGTEEMCMRCILELTKRALLIPKYDKTNCSYGSRYIKQLNACLRRLCALDEPKHIAQMLHYSLSGLFEIPGDRGGAVIAVLNTVMEILRTVQAGSTSKLASTRMMMRKISTLGLEQVLLEHLKILSKMLKMEVKQGMSLQQLRLAIADLFACLFASTNSATLKLLVDQNIAAVMFSILTTTPTSSLLHCQTVKSVETCFDVTRDDNADTIRKLRKQWLSAMQNGNTIWTELKVYQNNGYAGRRSNEVILNKASSLPLNTDKHGYSSAYMNIALILRRYAMKVDGKNDLRYLLGSEQEYAIFLDVRRHILDGKAKFLDNYLCGPPPEKTASSLLASPSSLAALSLDNIDAV